MNEDDDPAFIRAITTPKRGVGAVTLEKLGAYAGERKISLFAATQEEGLRHRMAEAQRAPLEAFAQFILRYQHRASREAAGPLIVELVAGMGYEAWLFDSEEPRPAESKWKNVQELMRWLGEKGERDGKSLIELTQTIALITMLEGREEGEVDAVRLSTLHASKGLEYGHVFLIGCEEGILPHQESIDNEQIEEERRLMYVGITRAQRSLTISHCHKRKRAGEWLFVEPSRFISELVQEDVRYIGKPGAAATTNREAGQARLNALKAAMARSKQERQNGDPG